MEASRATYFSQAEQQLLMEAYDEVCHIILKKGNTAAVIKHREKAWQTIADRLNATNVWQKTNLAAGENQVQEHFAVWQVTPQITNSIPGLTTAEELALELNKGKPVMEGIQGGTSTDSCPARESGLFIQASVNTVSLLDPPDHDPLEASTSATGERASVDEETVSLDSERIEEDPDTVQADMPTGNINLQNSQTVRCLYATHLKRHIQLTELQIREKKRKLEEMDLDEQIKRKTLRKLDLENQILERSPS